VTKATFFSKRFVFLESLEFSVGWEKINPILVEFARKRKMTLFVSYSNGSFSKPIKDPGNFYIRFFSSPLERGDTETTPYTSELNGPAKRCEGCGDFHDSIKRLIDPSGLENSVVIKNDFSVPVAEIVDDTLYILFDNDSFDDDDTDDTDDIVTYTKFILNKVDEVYQSLPQTNEEREGKNQQKLEEFYQSYRAFFPETPESKCRKQFDLEYIRLVTSPGVESVMFSNKWLYIFTDRILRSDTKEGLGKLLITINFGDEDSDCREKINFQYLSRKEDRDTSHDTVYKNGCACLGTIDDMVGGCLEKCEFAVLTQLLVAFLRQG